MSDLAASLAAYAQWSARLRAAIPTVDEEAQRIVDDLIRRNTKPTTTKRLLKRKGQP